MIPWELGEREKVESEKLKSEGSKGMPEKARRG
jgi:hypothetical protein